jgi:hypothetical protein
LQRRGRLDSFGGAARPRLTSVRKTIIPFINGGARRCWRTKASPAVRRRGPRGSPQKVNCDVSDDDEDLHAGLGRRLSLLHEVVSASVEGAPGCVLFLEFGYFFNSDEWDTGQEIFARLMFSADGGEQREMCIQRQVELNGYCLDDQGEEISDELPQDFDIFNPKFWHTETDPMLHAARQAFADRFSVNDPLRTCDMHQTLIAFLHHSWEVFVFDTRAYRGDYGPWVPITVPWQ